MRHGLCRVSVSGALAEAGLFFWPLVPTLLSDSIHVRPLPILLKLLELLEGRVLLEISHFRRVIVSGRRLVVHTRGK